MKTTNYKKAYRLDDFMHCLKDSAPYRIDLSTGSTYELDGNSYVYCFDFNNDTDSINTALESFVNSVKDYEVIVKTKQGAFINNYIQPACKDMVQFILNNYRRSSTMSDIKVPFSKCFPWEAPPQTYSYDVYRVELHIDDLLIDTENKTITIDPLCSRISNGIGTL